MTGHGFSATAQCGALQRVDCPVCGRDVTVCSSGLVRAHRSMRVGRDGKPYIAYDDCSGGGWPAVWPEGEAS